MNEFLHMGGYAAYVWSAFGLTLLVMLINFAAARRGLGKMRSRIRNRNQAEQNS